MGEFDCASEVTGIEFNAQMKQIATSHHSSLLDLAPSRAVMGHGNIMNENSSNNRFPPFPERQIHGTESSVQLWQLCSDKLTPILELGRKIFCTT